VLSLSTRHLIQRRDDLLVVAQLISSELRHHLVDASTCLGVLGTRPATEDW